MVRHIRLLRSIQKDIANRIDAHYTVDMTDQVTFKLSELRAALIASLSISPANESKFNNRIKNLARIGFYDFGETKRGSSTQYGWTEMLKTGVACELFRAGLGPVQVREFFKQLHFEDEILKAMATIIIGNDQEKPFLYVTLRGLKELQKKGLGAQLKAIKYEADAKDILSKELENPVAFIDLTAFAKKFYTEVEKVSSLSELELTDSFKAWAREYDL